MSKDNDSGAGIMRNSISVNKNKAVEAAHAHRNDNSEVNIAGRYQVDSVYSSKQGDDYYENGGVVRLDTHKNASLMIEENYTGAVASPWKEENPDEKASPKELGKLIQIDKTAMHKTMNFPAMKSNARNSQATFS